MVTKSQYVGRYQAHIQVLDLRYKSWMERAGIWWLMLCLKVLNFCTNENFKEKWILNIRDYWRLIFLIDWYCTILTELLFMQDKGFNSQPLFQLL